METEKEYGHCLVCDNCVCAQRGSRMSSQMCLDRRPPTVDRCPSPVVLRRFELFVQKAYSYTDIYTPSVSLNGRCVSRFAERKTEIFEMLKYVNVLCIKKKKRR